MLITYIDASFRMPKFKGSKVNVAEWLASDTPNYRYNEPMNITGIKKVLP